MRPQPVQKCQVSFPLLGRHSGLRCSEGSEEFGHGLGAGSGARTSAGGAANPANIPIYVDIEHISRKMTPSTAPAVGGRALPSFRRKPEGRSVGHTNLFQSGDRRTRLAIVPCFGQQVFCCPARSQRSSNTNFCVELIPACVHPKSSREGSRYFTPSSENKPVNLRAGGISLPTSVCREPAARLSN
jgi:hypothetical protein